MNILKINYKAFIFLTLSFIIMTAIGTVTHELGHYSVAKSLGYQAKINYKSSSHWNDSLFRYFNNTSHKYSFEIKNKLDFPGKEKYFNAIENHQKDRFWITFGGPLQTMFTGSIGLLLLLLFKNKHIKSNKITFWGWTLVFMSLFWLRQIANLCTSLFSFFYNGKLLLRGDEVRLALYLNINIWIIQAITGFLGLIVLFIVLKQIPKTLLVTFSLSGCIGGVLGFYLWLIKFGHHIMP